jgi:hypothetical protein
MRWVVWIVGLMAIIVGENAVQAFSPNISFSEFYPSPWSWSSSYRHFINSTTSVVVWNLGNHKFGMHPQGPAFPLPSSPGPVFPSVSGVVLETKEVAFLVQSLDCQTNVNACSQWGITQPVFGNFAFYYSFDLVFRRAAFLQPTLFLVGFDVVNTTCFDPTYRLLDYDHANQYVLARPSASFALSWYHRATCALLPSEHFESMYFTPAYGDKLFRFGRDVYMTARFFRSRRLILNKYPISSVSDDDNSCIVKADPSTGKVLALFEINRFLFPVEAIIQQFIFDQFGNVYLWAFQYHSRDAYLFGGLYLIKLDANLVVEWAFKYKNNVNEDAMPSMLWFDSAGTLHHSLYYDGIEWPLGGLLSFSLSAFLLFMHPLVILDFEWNMTSQYVDVKFSGVQTPCNSSNFFPLQHPLGTFTCYLGNSLFHLFCFSA